MLIRQGYTLKTFGSSPEIFGELNRARKIAQLANGAMLIVRVDSAIDLGKLVVITIYPFKKSRRFALMADREERKGIPSPVSECS